MSAISNQGSQAGKATDDTRYSSLVNSRGIFWLFLLSDPRQLHNARADKPVTDIQRTTNDCYELAGRSGGESRSQWHCLSPKLYV